MEIRDIYIATYLIMHNVDLEVIKKDKIKAVFIVPEQAEELVKRFYSDEKELVLFANTMRNLKAMISNTPVDTK